MLREFVAGLWCCFEGVQFVTRMNQGCGAGNGLADLLFCAAFAKILKRIWRTLEEQDLLSYCTTHCMAKVVDWVVSQKGSTACPD